jgi:hypothetical protein
MLQGLPTGLSNVKHSKEEAAALVGLTSSKPGKLFCASILGTKAVFGDLLDPSFSIVLVCRLLGLPRTTWYLWNHFPSLQVSSGDGMPHMHPHA